MLATILLLGLLAVATATDVARHKIYNWTVYPGILAALTLNALGSAAVAAGWVEGSQLQWHGWVGLADSLAGFAACGAILLAIFVLMKIGGGDVKLMAMIGAFLGADAGIRAMLWTFVLGGCVGLMALVWRMGPWRLTKTLGRQLLWVFRFARPSPLTEEERKELQPPLFLAPSALAAVLIVQLGLAERWM